MAFVFWFGVALGHETSFFLADIGFCHSQPRKLLRGARKGKPLRSPCHLLAPVAMALLPMTSPRLISSTSCSSHTASLLAVVRSLFARDPCATAATGPRHNRLRARCSHRAGRGCHCEAHRFVVLCWSASRHKHGLAPHPSRRSATSQTLEEVDVT